MAEGYIRGISRSSSSSSRRRSGVLPQELQEEILVRLPVKSLIRFESVCKTWLSRFHSRGFINLYDSSRHLRNPSSELHPISTTALNKMIPGLADPCLTEEKGQWRYMFRMLGPLNGIYCITSFRRESNSGLYSILSTKIALLNPATREHKLTNPFPCELHPLLSGISSKRSHILVGFGALENDHTVVALINYNYSSRVSSASFLVLAYSVRTGVWKKLVDYESGKRNVGEKKATEAFNIQGGGSRIFRVFPYLEECPQRFFKGRYHWIAKAKGGDHKRWFVLSYNFAEESFKLIGMPPFQREVEVVGQECDKQVALFVLHDHLAAIYIFTVCPGADVLVVEVAVWMMMDYGVEESWTRIHTIKPGFRCGIPDAESCILHGVRYTPLKGGIRIEKLVFRHHERIISCDDVSYQEINFAYPSKLMRWNIIGISTYIETLERLCKDSIMF